MPMSADPASLMIILTSAKSVLMRPGVVISSVMPCTPCSSTSSAILKASHDGGLLVGDRQESIVGDDDLGVDLLAQALDALVGLHGSAAPLEAEGSGDDADGQRTGGLGDLGDDRGRAGAGPAALAGGDEHHVGTGQRLLDLVAVILGGLSAHLGIAAGTEAAGEIATDVDLDLGVGQQQRLGVGVDGDELDPTQTGIDHPVHGVDAATAHADDLDDREVVVRIVDHGSGPVSSHVRRSGPRLDRRTEP